MSSRKIDYTRVQALDLFLQEGPTQIIAEIGVLRGTFSASLLPFSSKLFLIDPWLALSPEEYPDYKGYTQKDWNEIRAYVCKRFQADTRVTIMQDTSLAAVKKFPDDFFDLVYLDGNHTLPFVSADLRAWFPKVRPGGYIAGHDYPLPSVKQAVDEFFADKGHFFITKEKGVASYFYKIPERNEKRGTIT